MKSTNEYIVICDFCKSKYIKRVVSDDGVDWLGHGRGTPTHYETPEFCPHCEHEIKKAYEIVMDREEKEKEELKKKIEILGGMDNLCFIEVRYADTIGAKNYSYVCDKNIINHYKGGFNGIDTAELSDMAMNLKELQHNALEHCVNKNNDNDLLEDTIGHLDEVVALLQLANYDMNKLSTSHNHELVTLRLLIKDVQELKNDIKNELAEKF